jgi:hypothetical protein
MARKTVQETYLLVRLKADNTVTVRQVHVDDQGQYEFGDGDVHLASNERAQLRNVVRSLKGKLEQ